jgi:hypothetical protein
MVGSGPRDVVTEDPHRVIENPVVGDRVTFLQTTEETGGAYVLMRSELAPRGGAPGGMVGPR